MKQSMILGCAAAAVAGVFVVWQIDKPATEMASVAAAAAAPPAMRVMYVAVPTATCSDGPAGTGKTVSKLALGDQINIVAEKAGWSETEFGTGLRCWTTSAALSPDRPTRSAPPRKRADAVPAYVSSNGGSAPDQGPPAGSGMPTRKHVSTRDYYSGCNAVRAAGAAPLYRGEPGYRPEMDGDGDGVACEPVRR